MNTTDPRRGEIWIVNLDPTVGSEIRKKRPAVVISSDAYGILPVRLAAPLTEWNDRYTGKIWFTKVEPTDANGLNKTGGIDALQIRSLDTQRFIRRLGTLQADLIEEVVSAVAAVVEYV